MDQDRPWEEFKIAIPDESLAIFRATTLATTSDGSTTLFLEEQWLDGMRIEDMAPHLYAKVPQRLKST